MKRKKFKKHAISHMQITNFAYGEWYDSIMNDKEPFWIPEIRDGWKASHFAAIAMPPRDYEKELFWDWCKNNLSKPPLCYMSDDYHNVEWWGFNTKEDMMLFLLKWL